MIALGSILAAIAAAAIVLGARSPSRVGRHLDLVAPRPSRSLLARWHPVSRDDLEHAGLGWTSERLLATKIASALLAMVAAAVVSLVVSVGPLVVAAAAYAGFVAPSLIVAERAAARRAHAERATGTLVEWLDALAVAGRPTETALASLALRPTGSVLLDHVLRRAAEAYALGAPLFRTLAHHAREAGLASCASLADELERSRELGQASLAAIRQRRDALRARERARGLDAASRVEGKLMLVLVLCYLPALMLLVVIPLFIGLLDGLFM